MRVTMPANYALRKNVLRATDTQSAQVVSRLLGGFLRTFEVDVIALTVDRRAHGWKLRGCSEDESEVGARRSTVNKPAGRLALFTDYPRICMHAHNSLIESAKLAGVGPNTYLLPTRGDDVNRPGKPGDSFS